MAVAARLSHTVALVTGGSSGLGAGAASCLVRHGARVLVADLAAQETAFLQWATALGVPIVGGATTSATNGQPVAHIAAYDNKGGPAVSFVTTDVTDVTQVTRALDAVERRFGEPLNALVNCAGIAVARKTLSKKGNPHPLEEFSRVLSVNAIGSFNTACLSAERMSRREMNDEDGLRGCIIHTASIAAYEGQVGQAAYAASKGAVVGMTLPMARDLAPWGIRVMTIVRSICVGRGNELCAIGNWKLEFSLLYLPVSSWSRHRVCLPLLFWMVCPRM